MRKAKDNAGVPTRYFRPDFQFCPLCGAPLRRKATVQDKVLITLGGRFRLVGGTAVVALVVATLA